MREAAKVIRSWERLVGGPLPNDPKTRARFTKTVVGDTWTEEFPEDWVERLQDWLKRGVSYRSDGMDAHAAILDLEAQIPQPDQLLPLALRQLIVGCCFKRRFFVTKTGRFGLGPARTGWNNRVCVLFRSEVPFILYRYSKKKDWFYGQAYVEEIMDYKGNLQEDLKEGRLKTWEFSLL